MLENKKNELKWNMVVIFDNEALPGKNIKKLIANILKVIHIKYVYISDIEGAGINILFENTINNVLAIDDFLNKVGFVQQFDWGDFFLFSEFPKDWETFEKKTYPEIISLTETTVRAIDDTYLYAYTPNCSSPHLNRTV